MHALCRGVLNGLCKILNNAIVLMPTITILSQTIYITHPYDQHMKCWCYVSYFRKPMLKSSRLWMSLKQGLVGRCPASQTLNESRILEWLDTYLRHFIHQRAARSAHHIVIAHVQYFPVSVFNPIKCKCPLTRITRGINHPLQSDWNLNQIRC